MKREILFRGKRLDSGEWVEGYLRLQLVDGDLTQAKQSANIFHSWMDEIGKVFSETDSVDPDTVGQFTGLTDSHDVKIFEGDIVVDADAPNIILTIVWNKGSYRLIRADNTGYPISWGDDLMVIGNVNNNPELIGGAS